MVRGTLRCTQLTQRMYWRTFRHVNSAGTCGRLDYTNSGETCGRLDLFYLQSRDLWASGLVLLTAQGPVDVWTYCTNSAGTCGRPDLLY